MFFKHLGHYFPWVSKALFSCSIHQTQTNTTQLRRLRNSSGVPSIAVSLGDHNDGKHQTKKKHVGRFPFNHHHQKKVLYNFISFVPYALTPNVLWFSPNAAADVSNVWEPTKWRVIGIEARIQAFQDVRLETALTCEGCFSRLDNKNPVVKQGLLYDQPKQCTCFIREIPLTKYHRF